MGAPSTTKLPIDTGISSSSSSNGHSQSETVQASREASKKAHNRRSQPILPTHGHGYGHGHGYHHHGYSGYLIQPIIYTPHQLFAISPDWSETVRARLQLLSSPEVLSRSPLEEQPPSSPSSSSYLGSAKKRRRSHCIHDLPIHARRITEEHVVDYTTSDHVGAGEVIPERKRGGGSVFTLDGDDEDDDEDDEEGGRGRSRSRRSSMASFRTTRRSERSVSRKGINSRRQSEGQRDRTALIALLATTPQTTPS